MPSGRCDSRNPGDLSLHFITFFKCCLIGLLKKRIALKANAPFGEQKSSDQHARVAKDLCPGASQPGLFLCQNFWPEIEETPSSDFSQKLSASQTPQVSVKLSHRLLAAHGWQASAAHSSSRCQPPPSPQQRVLPTETPPPQCCWKGAQNLVNGEEQSVLGTRVLH
eukprot:COSAG04_NODE_4642_length_1977_cov_2.408946_1_plen_166_part_00